MRVARADCGLASVCARGLSSVSLCGHHGTHCGFRRLSLGKRSLLKERAGLDVRYGRAFRQPTKSFHSESTNNNRLSSPWRIVISLRRAARSLSRTATFNAEPTRGTRWRLDMHRSGAIEAVASNGSAVN